MSTTLAERTARRTRLDVLEAAVALLAQGEEPTLRATAAAAGIGERTIYRHFTNREGFEAELDAHLGTRLGVPLCASADELGPYVVELFSRFEANPELVTAMVTSRWSQPHLAQSRSANLEALTDLLRRAHPGTPDDEVVAGAASLRTVLSGGGWFYQRISCGLPNEVVTSNALWMVDAVRACLGASAPSTTRHG
jgi:AcrR family transcriptional regulator